jgi:hypothetical protein
MKCLGTQKYQGIFSNIFDLTLARKQVIEGLCANWFHSMYMYVQILGTPSNIENPV